MLEQAEEIITLYTPDSVAVKCGTLEIDLNEHGYGTIKIDGQPLEVTSLKLNVKAGELPTAEITTLCIKYK